jgi:hypothetical protein
MYINKGFGHELLPIEYIADAVKIHYDEGRIMLKLLEL